MQLNCVNFAGFHNRWNRSVGVRHPKIWTFIRKVKDEERQCMQSVRAAERGDSPPKRKKSYRLLERRIRHLKKDYRAGRRNVNQYWRAIAYVVHNFQ